MSFLGTRRVLDIELHVPPAGGFFGSGHIESGQPPPAGRTTLTIGDLQIVGTVLAGRGGTDSPDRPAFVFAGGYGWHALLPPPGAAYASPRGVRSSPNGVRLSTVLRDLGAIAGEAYDAPSEVSLGPAYGWTAGARGRAVLADLVARGAVPTWRVLPSGRTSFSSWPALPAADARGRITDRRLAWGGRDVALDHAVTAWLPGATVQGITIARTVLRESAGELRAEVYDA
jgi:hypothetical protein